MSISNLPHDLRDVLNSQLQLIEKLRDLGICDEEDVAALSPQLWRTWNAVADALSPDHLPDEQLHFELRRVTREAEFAGVIELCWCDVGLTLGKQVLQSLDILSDAPSTEIDVGPEDIKRLREQAANLLSVPSVEWQRLQSRVMNEVLDVADRRNGVSPAVAIPPSTSIQSETRADTNWVTRKAAEIDRMLWEYPIARDVFHELIREQERSNSQSELSVDRLTRGAMSIGETFLYLAALFDFMEMGEPLCPFDPVVVEDDRYFTDEEYKEFKAAAFYSVIKYRMQELDQPRHLHKIDMMLHDAEAELQSRCSAARVARRKLGEEPQPHVETSFRDASSAEQPPYLTTVHTPDVIAQATTLLDRCNEILSRKPADWVTLEEFDEIVAMLDEIPGANKPRIDSHFIERQGVQYGMMITAPPGETAHPSSCNMSMVQPDFMVISQWCDGVTAEISSLESFDSTLKPKQNAKEKRAKWIAEAMMLRRDNPHMKKKDIAKMVGVDKSQLTPKRCPEFAAFEKMLAETLPPQGHIAKDESGITDVVGVIKAPEQHVVGEPIPGSRLYWERCAECHEEIRVCAGDVGNNPLCESCR